MRPTGNDALAAAEAAVRRPVAGSAATASAAPLGVVPRRKPSRHAFGLALATTLAAARVPLLLVKANSCGAYFKSPAAPGLRVMTDLNATARHALGFVLGRMSPGRCVAGCVCVPASTAFIILTQYEWVSAG